MRAVSADLVVGATGHRMNRLKASTIPSLLEVADQVLAACEQAEASRYKLVSALAEGADRVIAHAALARGWTLLAPLPFEPSRYEQDFENAASKEEFRSLCARAQRTWVVGPPDCERSEGYVAVSEAIVSASDGLLAIWDGRPAAGRGGTAELVRSMLDHQGAVAWIAPDGECGARVLSPPKAPRANSKKCVLAEAWARQLGTAAWPSPA